MITVSNFNVYVDEIENNNTIRCTIGRLTNVKITNITNTYKINDKVRVKGNVTYMDDDNLHIEAIEDNMIDEFEYRSEWYGIFR